VKLFTRIQWQLIKCPAPLSLFEISRHFMIEVQLTVLSVLEFLYIMNFTVMEELRIM
jgi:hypothetical protein